MKYLFTVAIVALSAMQAQAKPLKFYPQLKQYLDQAAARFDEIPDSRKEELQFIAQWIQEKKDAKAVIHMTFVCTHNSRRSHLAMIWAAAAADYYDVNKVITYSGGTEATAFNPRAVAAVERAGVRMTKPNDPGNNPKYELYFAPRGRKLIAYSKKYDDAINPKTNFCAVMVCSDADKNCPFVEGAELRVGIPYKDPKASDGTPEEAQTYDERSRQIATEMMYMFSLIK
jgi:arsenate reductase (thioredoxin)